MKSNEASFSEEMEETAAVLEKAPRGEKRLFPVVRDYDVANVSDKVVRTNVRRARILSHKGYIVRNVLKSSVAKKG